MPSYIHIDSYGNSYILDKTLYKILLFDLDGSPIDDLFFHKFNIVPISFLVRNKEDTLEFMVLDPYNSQGNKIHLFNYQKGDFTELSSFGSVEDLLLRLPFLSAPIGLTSKETSWTGHSLDLDIDIFSCKGAKIKTIESHKNILPGPHINSVYFKGFNRLSESLDTYYKYTRLYRFYFLQDFVLGYYFGPNDEKDNRYFIFFDNEGNPLNICLRGGNNISIVGSYADEIYVNLGIEENEITENVNPFLVIYRIKNSN